MGPSEDGMCSAIFHRDVLFAGNSSFLSRSYAVPYHGMS